MENNEIADKKSSQQTEANDLEKVTDFTEDKNFSDRNLTESLEVVSVIDDHRKKETVAKMAKENALLNITLKKEDVDLIMSEFDVSKQVAESKLRQYQGDVYLALKSLI